MYRTYLKPALPHLCAIVVFVIISVAYFSPEIFEGKTILGHETAGYGDICPVTTAGRIVSIFSSLFGVAIIALPSGVITASYLEKLKKEKEKREKDK